MVETRLVKVKNLWLICITVYIFVEVGVTNRTRVHIDTRITYRTTHSLIPTYTDISRYNFIGQYGQKKSQILMQHKSQTALTWSHKDLVVFSCTGVCITLSITCITSRINCLPLSLIATATYLPPSLSFSLQRQASHPASQQGSQPASNALACLA